MALYAVTLNEMHTLYEDKAYAQVIETARSAYGLYDQSALHMLWAQSAQAMGDRKSAMSAYERVLMIEPDNVKAQIALVQLYHELGRDMLAMQIAASLKNQQLTPQQRSQLAFYDRDYTRRLKFRFALGGGYDTNIGAHSDIELSEDIDEKVTASAFMQMNTALSLSQFLGEGSAWYVQGDLGVSAKHHDVATYYDVYNATTALGAGYQWQGVSLYLPLEYSRLYYLDRDLLARYAVAPSVAVTLNPHVTLKLGATYAERRFVHHADAVQDDTMYGASAVLFYEAATQLAYIGTEYSRYDACNPDEALFIDKDEVSAYGAYALQWYAWQLSLDYRYQHQTYDDDTSEQRVDDFHSGGITTGWAFGTHWYMDISYRLIHNGSNVDSAAYDKQVSMLQLRYGF